MTTTRASYESALNKGHLYSWDQRWEEAISQFEIAIQQAPHKPAAHAGLGMAHLELDHLREALESYKNAARSSKGDAIYLRHVADVQERMDKHLDAAKTYVAMGEMAIKKRQMNDAVNHWHRATLLDPDLLRAHQNLASVYKQKNIIPGAVQEYLAMVRILLKKDDRQQALAVCQLALELDPRNADVLTAIELIEQGETEIFKEETAVSSSPPPDQIFEHIQTVVPIQDARRMALEQLAAKVFAEDDETDLNKIERDTLLSQALDFQTHNKINEAISAYERALAIGEDSSDAHFNLGLLYQDKLRFEEAVHEFNLTVQDQKYELVSHFALGESHRARGRLPEAIEHFITVLKIVDLETVNHDQADRLIELYEGLADSLITKGEPEQATSFANALVEFLNQKGWQDKVKEARTRLNTISDTHMMILGDVLTAGTEQVLESLYLSQEYAKRGLVNSAMEETFRAIQLAPNYLPAHIRLAELLSEQGRTEAATVKMVAIADTYRARGDVNGAILSYEKAATTDTLDVAVKSRLIDLLRRHGQIDRALTHYLNMGQAYYEMAQIDKARESYQQALKLAPRGATQENWQSRFMRRIAEIDLQRLDWRRALPAYEKLHQQSPTDEEIALPLIDLYFKAGQPTRAAKTLDQHLLYLVRNKQGRRIFSLLEELVTQRPSEATLVYRLSRIYIQQKRSQEAITLLDRLGEAQLEANNNAGAKETIKRILKLNPPKRADYEKMLNQLHR